MSAFGGKADIEGQGARRLRGALRGAEVINSLMIEPRENFETWLMIGQPQTSFPFVKVVPSSSGMTCCGAITRLAKY